MKYFKCKKNKFFYISTYGRQCSVPDLGIASVVARDSLFVNIYNHVLLIQLNRWPPKSLIFK